LGNIIVGYATCIDRNSYSEQLKGQEKMYHNGRQIITNKGFWTT